MGWLERYKEQACAWRQEAKKCQDHGKEKLAAQAANIAEVYDALAEEEELSPLSTTREEVQEAMENDGHKPCLLDQFSSRICEYGTKGCVVGHGEV